jgi:hypothetical protein
MGDADLWGYGDDEPEPDHFSDSSGEPKRARATHRRGCVPQAGAARPSRCRPAADDERKRRSDTEGADLLPEKKRRKLQKLGYEVGRRRRPGRSAGADKAVQLDSEDDDIDRQLLKEAKRRQGLGGTSAAAAAAFAAAGQPLPGAAGGAAPRGAAPPPVDSRCSELLATAQYLQKKLAAAQQEDLLSGDDDDEPLSGCRRHGWVLRLGWVLLFCLPAALPTPLPCCTPVRVRRFQSLRELVCPACC